MGRERQPATLHEYLEESDIYWDWDYDDKWRCKIDSCDKSFVRKRGLVNHRMQAHGLTVYQANISDQRIKVEGQSSYASGFSESGMAKGDVMERLPLTLCMEHGPGEGKSFPATQLKRVTIGRTRTNNYPIKDPTISQKHAFIEWRVHCWVLVDVGSSNGTDVNGKVLVENQPVQLGNGDLIRFGEFIKVRVQIEEEEEEEEEEEVEEVEEMEQEEMDEEDEEPGVTVEEWFEQERLRIVQTVHARADSTILEMKENAEQLKKMFREHAGVD